MFAFPPSPEGPGRASRDQDMRMLQRWSCDGCSRKKKAIFGASCFLFGRGLPGSRARSAVGSDPNRVCVSLGPSDGASARH